MKKNTVNALERVTNLSDLAFVRENENNTTSSMEAIVNHFPEDSKSVLLYSFKLLNCGVTEKRFNLNFKKTNAKLFFEHFRAYWYHLERNALEEEYKKLMKNADAIGFEARADVVRARYDEAMAVLAPYKKCANTPDTIRLLVLCARNAKEELFPDAMRKDFAEVKKVIKSLNDLDANSDNADDSRTSLLKDLRNVIGKYVYPHVWVKTEDGAILNYVPKCNARLAQDVYRIAQEARRFDNKDGVIKVFYADTGKLMREIVLACFEELQIK